MSTEQRGGVMGTIPPHIAITYQPKSVYELGKRGVPSARPSTTISPDTCKLMAKPLPPGAQAVMDAVHNQDAEPYPLIVAAALRAAVDQVISLVPPPCADFDEHAKGFLAAHVKYRRELLAIADTLEAPSLLERALAGDASAARQFLHEAGYTDASGNWLPKYQPQEEPGK